AEPTKDSIVLTDPLLLEHKAAGSGGDLGKHLWKRPVRDRDTTSCPLTALVLEPERTPGHQADRWIKAKTRVASNISGPLPPCRTHRRRPDQQRRLRRRCRQQLLLRRGHPCRDRTLTCAAPVRSFRPHGGRTGSSLPPVIVRRPTAAA